MKSKLIALLLLIGMTQCRRTDGVQLLGYDYFPLETGKYWVYRTDSVIYNDFDNSTTSLRSYTRIQIDSTIQDGEGQSLYCISHHWRRSNNEAWDFQGLSWLKRSNEDAQRVQDDQRVILMTFPVNDFTYWDLNEYNTLDERRVRYIGMGASFEAGGIVYPNTVQVEWPEDKNPYFHTGSRETYASGTGLIHASFINTETQNGKTKGYTYEAILEDTNW